MENMTEEIKCKFYDKGYCKKKDQCNYYHPTNDCEKCENIKTCRLRHRIICRYGKYCYHNNVKACVFRHMDIPLARNDNQEVQAHKDILAAPKPIKKMKKLIN